MTDLHGAIDAVWKLESAKIIAGLTRLVRDVGLAEELAQDALVAAMEQWPASGVPDNPGAWLMTIARRRAVDHIRRAQRQERAHEQIAHDLRRDGHAGPQDEHGEYEEQDEQDEHDEQDDTLRLMFLSCHPVLPAQARVALTLKLLGGLSAAEIARAFLVTEQTIARRVAEAKRTLSEHRVRFELPGREHTAERLSSVLDVIYLIFNEGYAAASGDDLMRPGLCLEALRLGHMLAGLAPHEAEVHGLVALMEIQASRTAARTGPSGEPIRLHEQNRGRWDQLRIRRGFTAMLRAREAGGTPGPYVLQAAIAVCHAQARTAEDTDWARIATLYQALARLMPTPIVRLNQAVAVSMAQGPQAGLELVEALTADPSLRDYHLLPSVRGDMLLRLGRHDEARLEFQRAASLAANAAERAFLLRRVDEIAAEEPAGATLGQAVRDFLGRRDLDPQTLRSYGQTLRRLCRSLGEATPLARVTAEQVTRVVTAAWGRAAVKTWNRHLSALRSFSAWAGLEDLTAQLQRRPDTPATAEPIGPARLDLLWSRADLPLRERTLWRLLHESGAPVSAVLSLNVEDIDLDDRRARAGRTWVTWRSQTALLLPALIAGRTRGPLFLSDRRPGPARTPADGDLCPHTGRRRLSYERAEYLFKQATRHLDPSGNGYTLRRLKPRDVPPGELDDAVRA
ncbi:RNA polymerase sigma factor (sigma-70 family) [Thermocatellispora tengchongensis]|uniref:RNA polymerase sigma factor n=1 Tax=Thermocatellispora tengchongensis TaxID=1073253 RepID=A0A840P2Z9_9ACTN|nr:sigma-70 family RNA polymerase sigma factor [Thermocatellispora tengchongensis]MBB5133742.1 RNA polymerase sigma factor (sigma-70 family) [Thermocatellispora tengchongensis]